MLDGFIKAAAASPKVKVADCDYNTAEIIEVMKKAHDDGVNVLVLPELCITGYTCGDLFAQNVLLDSALLSLRKITAASADCDMLVAVGLPIRKGQKLYNCAAVVLNGKVLGIVPKTNIPSYGELNELRTFTPSPSEISELDIDGTAVAFGAKQIFKCENVPDFTVGVEICEDLCVINPPSNMLSAAGANIILNLAASSEIVGREAYRCSAVKAQSSRLMCGYVYADAGYGESTTDLVFAGHNIIAENGDILALSKPFGSGYAVSEIDLQRIESERMRNSMFPPEEADGFTTVNFSMSPVKTVLTRIIEPLAFVPSDKSERDSRCETILNIQASGLCKRIEHAYAKTAIVAVSGGLDSTLALIVSVKAMDMLGRARKDIIAVTMPCFGTTARTKSNAESLCERFGVTLKTVNIADSVRQHFKDIGQDESIHDVTYENSQARIRTLVAMDIANRFGGLVVGTGDLSELALGWATYNGDHMSMYGVNASVPKTLIRSIVGYYAETAADSDKILSEVLYDILDTPISPELLPSDGNISQKTEDIVGPYELHDFYLYYLLRYGFAPSKIFRLAKYAFGRAYSDETILKWLRTFCRRFFIQQFKRSCIPDGPKVGYVTLSPRGDWHMPSDASFALWLADLDKLTEDCEKQ